MENPFGSSNMFPSLLQRVTSTVIPLSPREDEFLWKHNTSGTLSMKEAFNFISPIGTQRNWAKLIWNTAIPPSKSFLIWRAIHKKIPTDANLSLRGCYMPSMCSMCNKHQETADHIFLHCTFALSLWNWLQNILNVNIDLTSILTIFDACNKGWSPHVKLTVLAALINIIHTIWFTRNNYRYNNIKPNLTVAKVLIIANVSLTGNLTKAFTGPAIRDFVVLKAFNINTHHPNAPKIMEVFWHPPILNWVKCNTDGASIGNPGLAACVISRLTASRYYQSTVSDAFNSWKVS
jgi:hypothetical protein